MEPHVWELTNVRLMECVPLLEGCGNFLFKEQIFQQKEVTMHYIE